MQHTVRDLLRKAVLPRQRVDEFLNPALPNWAFFDPVIGYRLRDSLIHDGVDDSRTIAHYASSGERRMVNYADQPCRLNTYGDSFTQCHQVNDGETWQEYLAAHFGEPVRNFGIGGHGVYQAYRRLLREEQTAAAAPYFIINIWSDDHFRSLYPWRWIHIPHFHKMFRYRDGALDFFPLQGNPWAHVHYDPGTDAFVEHENPLPTPAALYQLCDERFVYETFKDEFDVHVAAAREHAADVNTDLLGAMARALGVPEDFSDPEATARTASETLRVCGLRASRFILRKTRDFATARGRNIAPRHEHVRCGRQSVIDTRRHVRTRHLVVLEAVDGGASNRSRASQCIVGAEGRECFGGETTNVGRG